MVLEVSFKSSSYNFSPGRNPTILIGMSLSGIKPASFIIFLAKSIIFTGLPISKI